MELFLILTMEVNNKKTTSPAEEGRCRSEGYPRTGYVTPGCVRGRHLAREPVVLSRRRRRRPPARLLVDGSLKQKQKQPEINLKSY